MQREKWAGIEGRLTVLVTARGFELYRILVEPYIEGWGCNLWAGAQLYLEDNNELKKLMYWQELLLSVGKKTTESI